MAASTRERILEIAWALPPGPRIFAQLDMLLQSSDGKRGLDEVAALIKRDALLAAHVIRVSNSVAFGGELRTGSVEEAVLRIGFQEVFRIVGEFAVTRLAERSLKHYNIESEPLREHMVRTAFMCEHLATACGVDGRAAYTAGLMRPLGLLVLDRLAEFYPSIEPYQGADERDYISWEGRLFGISGCEVAAMVLTEWQFPPGIVDAIRNQFMLRSDDLTHRLTCVVNLASGVISEMGHGLEGEDRQWGDNPWKLEALGLTEEAFEAVTSAARKAFTDFESRRRGASGKRERKLVPPRQKPALAPMSVIMPDAAVASPPPADESCNFEGSPRVLETNDAPPVPTRDAGLSPATDFTTFMRNYQDMVFSTAARLTGNDAQAEDISQEVFLKAYDHFDHLSTSPTAGGWLKTVATNLSLNHLSRYRKRWRFFSEFRRNTDDAEGDEPPVEFAAPDTFFSAVDADDRRALVEQALAQLPQHQRVPLVLYHFEDMPYDDIARKLGVSLAKVKTDILRARAALAKILTRSGTAHDKVSL